MEVKNLTVFDGGLLALVARDNALFAVKLVKKRLSNPQFLVKLKYFSAFTCRI